MTNMPYISDEVLKAYRGLIASSPVSTQKRKNASLNKFFNWASTKGYIEKSLNEARSSIQSSTPATQPLIPAIEKPVGRKYLSISNIIGLSLVLLVAGSTFLLVKNSKIPIPFIFTPASTDTNLVSITDSTASASSLSLATLSATVNPTPTITATPTASPTETPEPTIIPTSTPFPSSTPTPEGPLDLTGTTISLSTQPNSDGSITLNPDGAGKVNLILEGSSGNLANFLGANLNKGNLIYGSVTNNSIGYDLLRLQSGSKPVDRFLVDAKGNTKIGGNLDEVHDLNLMGNLIVNGLTRFTSDAKLNLIRGYYQEAGNFDIQQGSDDYALIHKTLSDSNGIATKDLLTLDLDEGSVSANSSKDTLVVKREDGNSDAYAIYVPSGNVKFDQNLGVGADLHIGRGLNVEGSANFRSQTLSNPNVSHGLTTLALTDVFYQLSSLSTTAGGTQVTAISDTDAQALNIWALIGSTDPTDSTPAVKIIGAKSDGSTGTADLAAAETVFQVQNNDNAASLTVEGDGDVVIVGSGTTCTIGNGTGATSCTSDARLKTNVTNLNSSLDKVNALRPITFNWLDSSKDQSTKTGLIAQETQRIYPEVVHEVQNGYLGIDYAALTVPLIKAVQELDQKVSNSTTFISQNVSTGSLVVKDVAVIQGNFIAKNIQAGSITTSEFISSSIVANSGKFIDFVASNVKAGSIVAENVTADGFYAFQGKVDFLLVQTGLVTPVVQTKLISPLADESDINVQIGNKEKSGKLAIKNAEDKEVASITSEGNASFSGAFMSNNLEVTGGATISGILYANNIVGTAFDENKEKLKEIEKVLKDVEVNQQLLSEITEASNQQGRAVEGDTLASLSVDRLYITSQAAVTSLSISQSLSLGKDLIFQSNAINTLSSPLSIQSLALAPIEIMAGKVKIDTKGNIAIEGNLTARQVNAVELKTDKIIIASNATGGSPPSSVDSSVIETNATAGSAVIHSETSEIIIKNPNITDTTLVYVTPTSPTNNQVLYLKSKEIGSFVVGFENIGSVDVNFNWWVIDTK